MDKQRVSSSNVRSIGYEATSSTLEVEFNSGSLYQYSGVPEAIYAALIRAASKGSYLNNHIKDRYNCKHVR